MDTTAAPELITPPQPPGPVAWLRNNLFSNWYNSLLTIVLLVFIYWAVSAILRWVFITADWAPVVRHPLLYLIGQYPRGQIWRVGLSMAIAALLFGMSWRVWGGVMRVMAFSYAAGLLLLALWPAEGAALTLEMRLVMGMNILLIGAGFMLGRLKIVRPVSLLAGWTVSLILTLVLLRGFIGSSWLPVVPTNLWGGLMVTLLLSVGGITLSFPFGVLLALGRRSSLPVLRFFSILFIEVVRGVPLISILFLASLLVPLFLPPEMRIDRLLRALIGMTVFSAAYMAENVRGGLAAVPGGQEEAAKAVGLRGYQVTLLIVLPQALRAVIPPMVGQFISLFKDTTLAFGIAVLELLAVGRSILQGNPEYFGRQMEVLLFIAAIFWVLSYLMSYASLRLEAALGVGER
jgi:general L-amino acid transport system permease protein